MTIRISRDLLAVLVALAIVLVVPATRIAEPRLVDSTATRAVPSPEPTPTATAVVDDFDITASGDLLIHTPVAAEALALGHGRYDFDPMFRKIRPIVRRAALSICQVETPLGPGPTSGYPVFNSPPELAGAIRWTGWDVCATAGTHSVDRAQPGIDSTLAALDAHGVAHAGTARSATEGHRITMLDVRGVRIAFLSYAYGDNGFPLPHPWSDNIISLPRVVADAKRARRSGAQLTIVNFHWGTEYEHAPNDQQVDTSRYLLKRRLVDVIVGQHVHVVQPIARIARRFVVYGEGNLISDQTAACCPAESQDGLIAVIHVHVVDGTPSIPAVDYVPIWVRHPDFTVLPVGAALEELIREGKGTSPLAQALRASYRRTVAYAGTGPHMHPIPARLP